MQDDDDLDDLPAMRRSWQRGSAMPASSEASRNKNRKRTKRGDAVSRRIGKQVGGISRRRNKPKV